MKVRTVQTMLVYKFEILEISVSLKVCLGIPKLKNILRTSTMATKHSHSQLLGLCLLLF